MDSNAEIPNSAALIETLKVGGMFTGLIILAITWFIVRLITGALERTGTCFVHRRLFLNQIATLVRFLFYIGGIAARRPLALATVAGPAVASAPP